MLGQEGARYVWLAGEFLPGLVPASSEAEPGEDDNTAEGSGI